MSLLTYLIGSIIDYVCCDCFCGCCLCGFVCLLDAVGLVFVYCDFVIYLVCRCACGVVLFDCWLDVP